MPDGKINTRAHETPLSRSLMGGGTILISETSRSTEESAEQRIDYGNPIAATDTLASMERQGLFRCCADGAWLTADHFSPDSRKRNGLQSICKQHRAQAERERRQAEGEMRFRHRRRKEKKS